MRNPKSRQSVCKVSPIDGELFCHEECWSESLTACWMAII